MKRYLIIGNGVAGASAAEKIVEKDPEGRIVILSNEPDAYYSRPRLPEYMAGEVPMGRITLRSAEWYASHGMELHLNTEVASVDTAARVATTADARTFPYDALLLATGASSSIPPIPGADKQGVFALRTAGDARAIGEAARAAIARAAGGGAALGTGAEPGAAGQSPAAVVSGGASAILIGGGLLGLEAGAALARMGLAVHVAEFFDRLLPRQMDAAGAARLQAMLEARGFTFLLGAKSKEIRREGGDLVLALEDGREARGGLVLVSAGVRGNVALAKQMGLAMDKGVTVDDRMKASVTGVYAAGDHVEHRGRLYGIWPASKAQGETAGINMAGGEAVYQGTTPANSLKVGGVDLTSAGDIDAEGKFDSAVWQDEAAYRKIVLENGRIKGFIFFGVTAGIKECRAAMEKGNDVGRFKDAMRERDFDFARLEG
jgi:nitrite reductase (NADH) large subunit